MPTITFKTILLVIGIIAITIISVLVISKFFNTNSKNNTKNIVNSKIENFKK